MWSILPGRRFWMVELEISWILRPCIIYNVQYNVHCTIQVVQYTMYIWLEKSSREREQESQKQLLFPIWKKTKLRKGILWEEAGGRVCLDGDEAGVGGKLGGKWRPPSAHSPPLTASSDTSTTHTTSYSCPLEHSQRFPLLLLLEQLLEETRETEGSYFPIGKQHICTQLISNTRHPKYPNEQKILLRTKTWTSAQRKLKIGKIFFGENRFATNDEVGVTLSNGEAWSGGLRPVIEGWTRTVIIDHWMQKKNLENKLSKGELELWPLIIDAVVGEREKLAVELCACQSDNFWYFCLEVTFLIWGLYRGQKGVTQ